MEWDGAAARTACQRIAQEELRSIHGFCAWKYGVQDLLNKADILILEMVP